MTHLVPPADLVQSPTSESAPELPTTRPIEKPPLMVKSEQPKTAPKKLGPVSITFELDPSQALPLVLEQWHGMLAFASQGLIKMKFQPPLWELVTTTEVEPLSRYYLLPVTEQSGRYDFMDQIREGHPEVMDLQPFGLMDLDFRDAMMNEISQIASQSCREGEGVQAGVRLENTGGFNVSKVTCAPQAALPAQ